MKLTNSITDVPGIEVGHAQDDDSLTGCTAILCRKGAVAGVEFGEDAADVGLGRRRADVEVVGDLRGGQALGGE